MWLYKTGLILDAGVLMFAMYAGFTGEVGIAIASVALYLLGDSLDKIKQEYK